MTPKKLFVLALDGVPFTLLQNQIQNGLMPNLRRLADRYGLRQMDSVIPPVSSVAWASFMTGELPHKHGIWGFVDRDPFTMDWFVPRTDRLRVPTLWERLSKLKKRVFVMNVPLTTPPRPVNGIIIGGFLETDINKATYPPQIAALLKARGYRIDADTEIAKQDLTAFVRHLNDVLDKRIETMWHFWQRELWDFFMLHVMETDRLHHFLWEYAANNDPHFGPLFNAFYTKIDHFIGRVWEAVSDTHSLLLLSDHGFTTLKKEVYLNRWLYDNGYLSFSGHLPQSLKDMHPASKAYSLYPGRIYVNLIGREKIGSVQAGVEYERLTERITQELTNLLDPETGTPVIKSVNRSTDVLMEKTVISGKGISQDGAGAYLPDLIAVPNEGYDLKGNLWHPRLFDKTHFNGMHTSDDAFLLSAGVPLPDERLAIHTLMSHILNFMAVK